MQKKSRSEKSSYILFYKPIGVLPQFTGASGRKTLRDYGPFPRDVYPVGRLDADSEGLLFLTNDKDVVHRLLEPRYGHKRTYFVQVERAPGEHAIARLRMGVVIEGRRTKEAEVRRLETEPALPPREKPIRFRRNVPTAWLEITLTEGRNRQVRKMTAAVGHPTLRLVRVKFGPLTLGNLKPGDHRYIDKAELRFILNATRRS